MDLRTEHEHIEVYQSKDGTRVTLKIVSAFREQMAELTPDEARELATMLRKAVKAIEVGKKAKR